MNPRTEQAVNLGGRREQPGTIPGRQWTGAPDGKAPTALAVAATEPGDDHAGITVNVQLPGGTVMPNSTWLDSSQLRELATDLIERAEVLDNTTGRNRHTPAWHVREGERRLLASRFLVNSSDKFDLAVAQAQIAQAHYLAAMADRGLTTHPPVVIHQHLNEQSRGDNT